MLILSLELTQELGAHGIRTYPEEGCGLLLGKSEGERNLVSALFPVENHWGVVEQRRRRFRITPADMMQAEMAAADRDLDIVGVFHSHPDCEPVASPRDLAWAAWSGYSYLITEIRRGRVAGSRAWQLLPDRTGFIEEPVVIHETRNERI